MDEVELILEDSVWCLVWERPNNYLHKFVGSHFSIFYHLEETIPNDCSAQKIFDVVDMMYEKV